MAQQLDPDSFGFLVTDIARLIRLEMDRRISGAGLGLTAGEGRALVHAARAGEVRQNVLADRMGVEAMTLSGYLDRLEARGLIERRVDPADRRAKRVVLTEAAESVLVEIRKIGKALRDEAQGDIPTEEWQALHDMLKDVRDRLGSARMSDAEDAAA